MKKRLSGCSERGDDTAILTQVSSGPEVVLLCTDCYNLELDCRKAGSTNKSIPSI